MSDVTANALRDEQGRLAYAICADAAAGDAEEQVPAALSGEGVKLAEFIRKRPERGWLHRAFPELDEDALRCLRALMRAADAVDDGWALAALCPGVLAGAWQDLVRTSPQDVGALDAVRVLAGAGIVLFHMLVELSFVYSSAKWAVDGSRRATDLFFCLAAFLAAVGRPVTTLRNWAGRMLKRCARGGTRNPI